MMARGNRGEGERKRSERTCQINEMKMCHEKVTFYGIMFCWFALFVNVNIGVSGSYSSLLSPLCFVLFLCVRSLWIWIHFIVDALVGYTGQLGCAPAMQGREREQKNATRDVEGLCNARIERDKQANWPYLRYFATVIDRNVAKTCATFLISFHPSFSRTNKSPQLNQVNSKALIIQYLLTGALQTWIRLESSRQEKDDESVFPVRWSENNKRSSRTGIQFS